MSDLEHQLYFEIPPVVLTVATKPGGTGRAEHFTASAPLMRRLDQIGKTGRLIVSLVEAGQEIPEIHVEAINHYLHACRGLRSFKRVCRSLWITKHAWSEFRERLNVPIAAVILHT